MDYNPQKIESKWQKYWEKLGLDRAKNFDKRKKQYILVEFPYPSGDGLHIGQVRSYAALDAVCRKKRMEGYNVLYPMGWDAFGLPTENYAIKTGIHPIEATKKNTDNFRRQLKMMGLSFDWSREINTTDPEYYKWTQWIFLKMFEKGLAYQSEMPINWCSGCKIGLANEEVIGGKCERCGAETEKKRQKQWMLKITAYADRLIDDLKKVDYSERIKTQQINWIGKSEGTTIKFKIVDEFIEVFTTRIDTIFGVTALVLAPEHSLIENLKLKIENWNEVQNYIKNAKKKSELERTDLEKEKTGIELKGVYAINFLNNEKIPVWVGDYVIAAYGGGAVMVVPAHDKRDYEFAQKYGLEIREVVSGGDISKEAFVDYGTLVNSGQFNGLESEEAIKKITEWIDKNKLGRKQINYHLHDWIFSRQHYWGEPIPIIHCEKCGIVPVPEKDLPVKLPYVKKYKPTNTGESPLAAIKEWVNVKCPKCGGPAKRETDTMPNWAGSNWYYIRYCDPKNDKKIADPKKLKYWMPVDWYNGGMEHTTLHLLYSRFIYKFLYDIKAVPAFEPYAKRRSHGIVLGVDGRKMSKSFGNVVNPDEVVKKYGADSLRLYEMFMGPYEEAINWSTEGLEGCWRFLKRIWVLFNQENKISKITTKNLVQKLHYTIKKIGDDLENMKFNTAVASMMELVNLWSEKSNVLSKKDAENFLKILAPFCPYICEELFQKLKTQNSKLKTIFLEKWPEYNEKLIKKETIELVIQVNGKVRDKIEVSAEISKEEAEKLALSTDKIKKWLGDNKPKVVIFVKGKLINIVI
ncbi:MAG: leucine--tRNA ligase [Candidatus Portnoybacteria bacterium RBG_13_40_8]|uniref:Leucine--tRNA ligase n=1 Tax=Candidatus Portnoybacteria bacterium RBG_13_40_8 TaxID=1801990 RepID=A0A1G2F520_9BACT|nr:MAG: leucine--tRNA ligase [Candidatus Portnoybacteria bacterium RBG_13_40_8]